MRLTWRAALLTLTLLALLGACGGGRRAGAPDQARPGQSNVTLGLQLAAPDSAAGPAQKTVTVTARDAHELYQLSCRVAYNAEALRLVSVERGELVAPQAVFFSSDRAAGFVPLAFTYRPGQPIAAGSGAVATLHFDVLDPLADHGIALIDDPEFLIARDAQRRALKLRLEVGQ